VTPSAQGFVAPAPVRPRRESSHRRLARFIWTRSEQRLLDSRDRLPREVLNGARDRREMSRPACSISWPAINLSYLRFCARTLLLRKPKA
jgi:hypothetical protein